jgi:hypothetical protein
MRRKTAMNRSRILVLLAVLIFPVLGLRPGTASGAAGARPAPVPQPALQEQQPAPTVASVLDREISAVEKEFVGAAEAMPEDKYDFSPESLKIPGSDYKGVRTFAVQVKHVAISNYFFWAPILGEPVPESLKGDNGGENVKSKADIIKLLQESFALGHKAAASLTTENMLQTAEHSKSTRLRLAMYGVGHVYDHYGQLVEYLRMNGIVPPASRAQAN